MKDLVRLNTSKLDKTLEWLESEFADKVEIINILFVLVQDYIFAIGEGISRKYLLEGLAANGFSNHSNNIRCFDSLEEEGYIEKKKLRPIIYGLSDEMVYFIEQNIL